MYLLRRSAARALSSYPRLIATPRVSPLPVAGRLTRSSKSTFVRTFHQSRIWRADESEKTAAEKSEASPAEAEAGETITTEPSAQELAEEVKEESIIDLVSSQPEPAPEPAPASPAATSAAKSRILYIGNLLFEVNTERLQAVFGKFGELENSRIVTDPRGLSKGFGYVEFKNAADAAQAVQDMNQTVLEGRRISVQYHVPRAANHHGFPKEKRRSSPPGKTLFIGNMSYQMSDRDLNDLFRDIKDVLDVRVAIDRRTGQPRGFAHADFVDRQAAERAKELLSDKLVYGRRLRVDFSAQASHRDSAERE